VGELLIALKYVAIGCVLLGFLPVLAGAYQFLLLPFSLFSANLERVSNQLPRLSVLIPAWNEGSVIGLTIDRLMEVDYPKERLRIYVVDDASSDETPNIVREKSKLFPENVFHIRRVAGGEGKAHTLNYGLTALWESDWTEALLIMDADVIYSRDSLRKMARHLADPSVGAITAYVKEGSSEPGYVQRFITFEYITATGASRRAQNTLGFLACLSGGAQMHSRANMMAIGAKIFSDTLAEDTFTTFRTQLAGRRAIFEPNAIVYAEEPASLNMLWKQRLRWARGNVQVTSVFRNVWLRKNRHPHLGSLSMSLLWFTIFLMPVFQILTSSALCVLYVIDAAVAWSLFNSFWILSTIVYLLVTLSSFVIDAESSRKSIVEGILFPGVVSLAVMVHALWPPILELRVLDSAMFWVLQHPRVEMTLTLFLYAWVAASMAVSYLAVRIEKTRFGFLAPVLIYTGGYGSLLCAVTLGAYIKEWQGAARTWDKTEKTGTVKR
jgi:cellulose synthase/poly-beta-1,6-N-acetylglucosamine synthase-like glycosyltransferase